MERIFFKKFRKLGVTFSKGWFLRHGGLNGQERTKMDFGAGDDNLRLPDNRATSLPLPESIRPFCR